MLVDEQALLAHFPAGTRVVDVEPLGPATGSPERVELEGPAGRTAVLLRRGRDPEHAANLLAIADALSARPGPWVQAIGIAGDVLIEPWIEGTTALAQELGPDFHGAAIDTIAALHALPVREGLGWDTSPTDLLPGAGMQLFRLGYASHEREAVQPALAAAQAALLETPFGFAHGALTANHLLFVPAATIVDLEDAGFGPQLFDLAAYLLTAGLDENARRSCALRYAAARGLPAIATADLADLAELVWGLNWLLGLPRRQIENLGDDAKSEGIRLMAERIDVGTRTPAGNHPVAAAIRRALWE